jgi:allantoicase
MKNKIIYKNSLIDLTNPALGTKIIFKTDDFFASANRILNPSPPIFKERVYDKNGKWMDGWESRRKRTPNHDYLIIKLGKPGNIKKIDFDTSHFNGNQPSMVSLEGCNSKSNKIKSFKWKKIIGKIKTKANSHHIFNIKSHSIFTHIKLNIFPDGGIARLRLYGLISTKGNKFTNNKINLASILNGAVVVACNNEHFGKTENIIFPGKAINMGDGWETRRRRDKGFDWAILNTVNGKEIKDIEVSTHHFKGNYPSYCTIQAAYLSKKINTKKIIKQSNKWKLLLNKSNLSANNSHKFKNKLMKNDKINYVKINIFPDGGISRFRMYGKGI